MWDRGAYDRLKAQFPEDVLALEESRGEVSIRVRPTAIRDVCKFLKEAPDLSYDMLVDLCGVDYLGREERFEVVYLLHSMKGNRRLRLKVGLREGESVPSLCPLWKGADWLEREVFDMFGVRFEGHPDLRRILTWEGYPHHPLRKDFPVEGYDEIGRAHV